MRSQPLLVVLPMLAALFAGCASPLHLQYDHGRAYTESIIAQADLTRPSVANSQYFLYGNEAEQIRVKVQEETVKSEELTGVQLGE